MRQKTFTDDETRESLLFHYEQTKSFFVQQRCGRRTRRPCAYDQHIDISFHPALLAVANIAFERPPTAGIPSHGECLPPAGDPPAASVKPREQVHTVCDNRHP